jgi:hypothetical protein
MYPGIIMGSGVTTLTNTADTTINVVKTWGTETVTIMGCIGMQIVVLAWLIGNPDDGSGANSLKQCSCLVSISLDGGGSYTDQAAGPVDSINGGAASPFRRTGNCTAMGQRIGIPTGDVKVRARLNHVSGGANGDVSFNNGSLMAIAYMGTM